MASEEIELPAFIESYLTDRGDFETPLAQDQAREMAAAYEAIKDEVANGDDASDCIVRAMRAGRWPTLGDGEYECIAHQLIDEEHSTEDGEEV